MPRHPDPDLEGRILAAASKLWAKGGEEALTMRAVAKAAGTNTPALYRRFKDRKDILRALVQRMRAEITALAEASRGVLMNARQRPQADAMLRRWKMLKRPSPRKNTSR